MTTPATLREQLWGVRLSIRYHDHLVRFFDSWHTIGRFVTLVLASSSVASIIGKSANAAAICALMAGVVTAAEMAFAFATKARSHSELKRRFCALEIKLCELKTQDASPAQLTALECDRLKIEADEPPIKHALVLLCHNELCVVESQPAEHCYSLSWMQQTFANFFEFAGVQPRRAVSI